MVLDINAIRKAQRADGPATILAIGTANPPNSFDQSTYPDYYFNVTKSDHKTELKEKFKRMCDKSTIKNRYMHLTEDVIGENPNMCDHKAPSLNARMDILVEEVPKLGEKASTKAIKEWGQPKSKITHLIFCNTGGVDVPGADFYLTNLLGLQPSVKRYMMYQQGCFGGGTVLRVAKDLAENNKGARVLAVCCEIMVSLFQGPDDAHLDCLLGQAIFGDGAAALIIGADPVVGVEKPLFQIVSALQTFIPDSVSSIDGHIREEGLTFHIEKNVSELVATNIQKCLEVAFEPLGISDWNSLFWMVHPGGPRILNQLQTKLNLTPDKLRKSREVLSEYGNMSSSSVLFVLDKMRTKSIEEGFQTTGEGLEVGVLLGFGPGITIETVVLCSVPVSKVP